MRARFILTKLVGALSTLAFVVAFNFFLFRVVNENTVESMFRGRNLSPSQIARLERQFNLDGSKVGAKRAVRPAPPQVGSGPVQRALPGKPNGTAKREA